MSKSLDPDLDSNCLKRLPAGDKNRHYQGRVKLTFDCEYEILTTSAFLIDCHTHILAVVIPRHVVHREIVPATLFRYFVIFRVLKFFGFVINTIPEHICNFKYYRKSCPNQYT